MSLRNLFALPVLRSLHDVQGVGHSLDSGHTFSGLQLCVLRANSVYLGEVSDATPWPDHSLAGVLGSVGQDLA